MKTMLFVGATLMIGASIYGVVDYQHNNRKKEFKTLYSPEKESQVVEKKSNTVSDEMQASKTTLNSTVTSKKEVVAGKVRKKRRLRSELFSRAPLKDEYIEYKSKDNHTVTDSIVVKKGKD